MHLQPNTNNIQITNIYMEVLKKKLHGVGLVDNKPSTNKLDHFVRRKKKYIYIYINKNYM